MFSKTLSTALLLTLTAPIVAQDEGHAGWHDDFDVAMAAAKESGKDLLIDFTGSDWCGWCIRLKEEVFDTDEFKAEAPNHFELVALDFPAAEEIKAKVPNPERNAELRDEHGIQGYPTILLMTSEGLVYGRTGYQAGGPSPYLEMLETMRTEGKARLMEAQELAKEFEAAEGEARMELLGRILANLEGAEADDPSVGLLGPAVEACLTDDLDQDTKIKVVRTLLSVGRTNETVTDMAEELDAENELGLFELVVQAQFGNVRDDQTATAALTALDSVLEMGFKDAEIQKGLLTNATVWSNGPLSDSDRAMRYAKLLQPLLTDSDEDAQLKAMVEEILNG
ncbi:MAG: thioredoxin family protein [Planctomycetota bacterium]